MRLILETLRYIANKSIPNFARKRNGVSIEFGMQEKKM